MGDNYTDDEFQNYLENHANQIKKQLMDYVGISDTLLEESSMLDGSRTIYGKYYNQNSLPSNQEIITDFKELINLYSQLKPDENGISISDTAQENDFLKFIKETYNDEIQIGLQELKRGKNLIFFGPPGSGKTVLSKIVSEKYLGKNAYSLYTVHSGTDYYDLVCRIVPQIDKNGNLIYFKERRFLLDALLSGKVLILDEINRTQIDTALGIFFTYLEREHRISDAEQIREILTKEIDEELEINDLRSKLSDFRIIGTLNVYDKTFLFKLGDALKRRFTFIEITTKKDLIENLVSSDEFKKEFISACDYQGDFDTSKYNYGSFCKFKYYQTFGNRNS